MSTLLWTAPAPGPLWHEVQRSLPGFTLLKRETWQADDLLPNDDVETWICNPSAQFTIGDKHLALFPALRLLVTPSTGANHVDKAALERRGIAFRSLLDDRDALEAISASAEHTFLLLLASFRNLMDGVGLVAEGEWHDERFVRGNELQGKTVGLVGYGRIGRRLERWLAAFGASTLKTDPYTVQNSMRLDDLFTDCDAVVICCAYTPETHGMVTGDHLRRMKKRAVLVNTARGEVFDEQSVLDALEERGDLRVAVDVLPGEAQDAMRVKDWYDTGALITPHMAGTTIESQIKAAKIACKLAKRYWKREAE